MTPADAYAELVRRAKEVAVVHSCSAVLGWDQQTYMPVKGAALRGEQSAFLAGLAHQKATDPRVGELLAAVEGTDVVADPESVEAANVRELRRGFDRATKLPPGLVEELARVTTEAQQTWEAAKKAGHFPTFRPSLEKVVALKRQEAQAVQCGARNSEYGIETRRQQDRPPVPSSTPHSEFRTPHLYDALLDEYEPGATAAGLKELFAGLTRDLVPLIRAIGESPRRPKRDILEREYPVDRQRVFAEGAAVAFGFDFGGGRVDTTAHPFCSGFGPGDCRITTRYNPRFFNEAFFGVLHETGHALYEQNLPADRWGTPCGSAASLGVHESQSRLWENQVGRGRPFWDYFFPRAQQTFPAALADVSADDFYGAVNDVRPSLIRVEADEATYNLHVAVRFEIELALLTGDLPVADLPAAWNEKIAAYLGLPVPDDARGCLQDIHWAFGGLGYFPTYTLGNLLAAQLMEAATVALGGPAAVADAVRRGDFAPLRGWLVENVHRHGGRYRPDDLCRRATGRPLGAEPFLRHLKGKFGPLYGV